MITPCPKCGKRHGRDHDHRSSGGRSVKPAASKLTSVLMALMLASAAAASKPLGITHPLAIDDVGVRHLSQKIRSVFTFGVIKEGGAITRRTEELEHEDHAHDHGVFEMTESEEHGHDEEDYVDHGMHDDGETFAEHRDEEGHYEHDHAEFKSETLSSNEEGHKPWGPVIGATLLVNLATLSGLLLLVVPSIRKGLLSKSSGDSQSRGKIIDILIPSFAVGALLATAVFLVLPEALHLIEGGHHDEGGDDHDEHDHRVLQDAHEDHGNSEGEAFAKWGCGILGGFLLPPFLALFFPHGQMKSAEEDSAIVSEDECQSCKDNEPREAVPTAVIVRSGDSVSVHDADEEAPVNNIVNQGSTPEPIEESEEADIDPIAAQVKSLIDYRLITTVVVGDFFCNFADGLFIGAAFLGCSYATAVSITMIALFHEIPQELADFIILTRYAGLSMVKACTLNFVTGLAVCIGGLLVFAVKPSDEAVGVILAIAAGVYFNLAAVESMPRVAHYTKDTTDKALSLFSIIIGTIPLGLILLDHKHC